MTHFVFDTNVIVSALLFNDSGPGRAFFQALNYGTILISRPLVKELSEVLCRGRITGPVKFVNQLLATWHLPPESACALLGFEPSRFAYVNDVLQGNVKDS